MIDDLLDLTLPILKASGGQFAVGAAFGYAMFWFAQAEARKEREHQRKLEAERTKELLAQIAQMNDRVGRLHEDKDALNRKIVLLEDEKNHYKGRLEDLQNGKLNLPD